MVYYSNTHSKCRIAQNLFTELQTYYLKSELERIRAQQLISGWLRNKGKGASTSNNGAAESDLPDNDGSEGQQSTEPNDCGTIHSGTAKSLKGVLKTTTHGIAKPACCQRCFKCAKCEGTFEMVREYNHHYSSTHSQIKCHVCGKNFTNPTSLNRHSYIHTKTEGVFPCDKCGESFPFESQLISHRFEHHKVKHFACSDCERWFIWPADCDAHKRSHKGPLIKCHECKYTTKDKRYYNQHKRVHNATLLFSCHYCGKRFCFYQQKKRHKKKSCTVASVSDE